MINPAKVRDLEGATAALEGMAHPMHPRPYVQALVAAARAVLDELQEGT